MKVSIIVVNYNTSDLTVNCLHTIYEKTKDIDFEVIVVDNASNDNSVEIIREKYPLVKIIASKENLGFGKANNLGVSVARGEFLFLLNSDTLLTENTVFQLYEFMRNNKNSKIGACGVSLYNKCKQATISAGNFPSLLQEFSDIGFRVLYKNFYQKKLSLAFSVENVIEDIFEVDYICGADIFIKRDLFEGIGGFDPVFFLYFEETDLFLRLKEKGYKSIILTKRHLIHLEGGSTTKKQKGFSLSKYIMMMSSKKKYYKKNKTKWHLLIMQLFNSISVTLHPTYKGNRFKAYREIWF